MNYCILDGIKNGEDIREELRTFNSKTEKIITNGDGKFN